jgi:hypothetical protein
MVAVQFGAGSLHHHTLGPAECGGELGHKCHAQGCGSVHAKAKRLIVVGHAREEVVRKLANPSGGRGIATNEYDGALQSERVEQAVGELSVARGQQKLARVADSLWELIW